MAVHFIWLRHDHRVDVTYLAWKRDAFPFRERFWSHFSRDVRFRRSLIGQDLNTLRATFPDLREGTEFPVGSYRRTHSEWSGDGSSLVWLDRDPEAWGWAAAVERGRVVRLVFIKG